VLLPPPQHAGPALPASVTGPRPGAAVQRQASLLTQPASVVLRTERDDSGAALQPHQPANVVDT